MQHEIFAGDAAVAYLDGPSVMIKANCRADAGRLDDRIPYAIAVTLETADDLRVPVFEEITERINLRTEVRALVSRALMAQL
jgi:hypothetical protein